MGLMTTLLVLEGFWSITAIPAEPSSIMCFRRSEAALIFASTLPIVTWWPTLAKGLIRSCQANSPPLEHGVEGVHREQP